MPGLKLDCRKCTEILKIERGCTIDSPIPGKWQINEWIFQRCPVRLVTRQSVEYLRAYRMFDRGYLPNQGGWLEQPAKFIEAMEVIEREVYFIQDRDKYDKRRT